MANDFYLNQPQLVIGFHGCEEEVRNEILNSNSKHLNKSDNPWDWLGDGIYFWLNDPDRALEWAKQMGKKKPSVIGAIINLGDCLNLCERTSIKMIQDSFENLKQEMDKQGMELVKNKIDDEGGFKLRRYLDCAVIKRLHTELENCNLPPFDTVYGYFQEGADAYPNAGIKEKTHIQICVRNTECIKGYFLPRIK